MRWFILLLLIPFPAQAEEWHGQVRIVDGDTIAIDRTRLRLLSMDAFESAQTCARDEHDYPCGSEATRALIGLIDQREVRCIGDRRDRYQRPLVHCFVSNLDLGREMVRAGWAVTAYGHEYDQDQADARAAKLGAWAGTFTPPKDWRKAQRAPVDPPWPPR
jgi:endonuclease YncB( thermonuclease family)